MEQTQPCPPSPTQSLLGDPEGPLRTCSRRKLVFPNRKAASASAQGASEDSDLNPGQSLRTPSSPQAPQQEFNSVSLALILHKFFQTAASGKEVNRFMFLTQTLNQSLKLRMETYSHSMATYP